MGAIYESLSTIPELAAELAGDIPSNRDLIDKIVSDLTRLGNSETDIFAAIDDVNIRMSWTLNSPCFIFSRSAPTRAWHQGQIICIESDEPNKELLTVDWCSGTRKIERFSEDIKPFSCTTASYKFSNSMSYVVQKVLGGEFEDLHEVALNKKRKGRGLAEREISDFHFDAALNLIMHHPRPHPFPHPRPHKAQSMSKCEYDAQVRKYNGQLRKHQRKEALKSRQVSVMVLKSLKEIIKHVLESEYDFTVESKLLGVKGSVEYLLLLLAHQIDGDTQHNLQCLEHPSKLLLRKLV